MSKDRTILWENVKGRTNYISNNPEKFLANKPILAGNSWPLGIALCEELEDIHKRIDALENKK